MSVEGGKKGCTDSERDESTDEQLQCTKQYPCTPHSTMSPATSKESSAPWSKAVMHSPRSALYGIFTAEEGEKESLDLDVILVRT